MIFITEYTQSIQNERFDKMPNQGSNGIGKKTW